MTIKDGKERKYIRYMTGEHIGNGPTLQLEAFSTQATHKHILYNHLKSHSGLKILYSLQYGPVFLVKAVSEIHEYNSFFTFIR